MLDSESDLDFRQYATGLSYIKDESFAIGVLNAVRNEKADQFVRTIREFGKSHLLRDTVFLYLEAYGDELTDELSNTNWNNIMTTLCQYIQTDSDKNWVERVQEATGRAFSQCASTFSANQDWQNKIGDQIVTWIRIHGNSADI